MTSKVDATAAGSCLFACGEAMLPVACMANEDDAGIGM